MKRLNLRVGALLCSGPWVKQRLFRKTILSTSLAIVAILNPADLNPAESATYCFSRITEVQFNSLAQSSATNNPWSQGANNKQTLDGCKAELTILINDEINRLPNTYTWLKGEYTVTTYNEALSLTIQVPPTPTPIVMPNIPQAIQGSPNGNTPPSGFKIK